MSTNLDARVGRQENNQISSSARTFWIDIRRWQQWSEHNLITTTRMTPLLQLICHMCNLVTPGTLHGETSPDNGNADRGSSRTISLFPLTGPLTSLPSEAFFSRPALSSGDSSGNLGETGVSARSRKIYKRLPHAAQAPHATTRHSTTLELQSVPVGPVHTPSNIQTVMALVVVISPTKAQLPPTHTSLKRPTTRENSSLATPTNETTVQKSRRSTLETQSEI